MLKENSGETKIPQTITPRGVWFGNLVLLIVIWVSLLWPLGWFWSLFFTLLILAGAIAFGVIAVEIKDFHGTLLFNPFRKKRRVVFAGLNFKLPWESVEEGGTNDD